MLISCVKTIYLYVCYEKFMCLKLNTFSKIVTHLLLIQNVKLFLKIRFSVSEITYLWKFFSVYKLRVYEKYALSIKCLVYEFLYLWNFMPMNVYIYDCVIYEMFSSLKPAKKSFSCKTAEFFANICDGNQNINLIRIPIRTLTY